MVLLVFFEMLRKLIYTGAQQCNLDLRRTGIAFMLLMFFDNFCFSVFNERQSVRTSKSRSSLLFYTGKFTTPTNTVSI